MPITIEDYSPIWNERYKRDQAEVEEALGGMLCCIDHIGSTAVPGLAAKPLIDMSPGIRSRFTVPERRPAPGYSSVALAPKREVAVGGG